MNPLNTDKNKINGISFMIIDGFYMKCGTIKNVIKNCFKSEIRDHFFLLNVSRDV